jgi:hypothetical protein
MQPINDRHGCLFQFLDSLPVMESHYCRSTSQKKYLLAEWQSRQRVYEFYVKDWCKAKKQGPLSIASLKLLMEKTLHFSALKKMNARSMLAIEWGKFWKMNLIDTHRGK